MVTFEEILKFNPYHDAKGRFASAGSAVSFTYSPGKSSAHDNAIRREKDRSDTDDDAPTGKGFKGTLYHGSPATNIDEFDINRAGENTSSGEKLIFFTDSKQTADDFSYERLEGSTGFTQQRGKKGRVYEVEVEMKHPLDFRNLTDLDIDNILQLDADGLLTRDLVKQLSGNHQLLKASLKLEAKSLKNLGYDGLIANMGKDGHNALEYAVVDSKQTRIIKSETIEKFNPYHDERGRFTSANGATSFTIRTKDPNKQHMADNAKEKAGAGAEPSADGDNKARMQTVHDVEDRIRSQFYESAAAIDKDGKVLFRSDGAMGEVGFSKEERQMMKGNTVTHNHPDDTMLSTEDAFIFVRDGVYEMRATTKDGTTYSLKQGEGYTYERGQKFFFDFESGMKASKVVAEKKTLKLRGDVMDGTMTEEQFAYEFGKVVTSEMIDYCNSHAKNYNVEFSVEKRKVESKSTFQVYTGKSANPRESVLFIGLQIGGADNLAIKGGEKTEDFHVTLLYGHFDPKLRDSDAIDVCVQSALDEIRESIPDKIKFDAIKRFPASESSDGKDVIYAQVAEGQLEQVRKDLLKALKENHIDVKTTFPEYKPHMTLAYIDPGEKYELSEIDETGTVMEFMIGHGSESSHENEYSIMKTDDDKRLVFGWASVSITVDGEQVEDRQEDVIDPEDLEAAAYEYVLKFRDTGEEHISTMRKKGKLVESCVFTAEKQKAMGIPEGILPIGWWIGFKIEDDAAWEKVKNGTYKMFSIEGKAVRVPIEKAAPNYDEFPSYDMWLEENLDASFEEAKAAKEYFKTHKRSVAKTFDEIIYLDEVFP